jgi:Type II secretion system (T2SS), protein E, N-terminal domain
MAARPNGALSQGTSPASNSDISHRPTAVWNSRAECGNPKCSGTWLSFLKDRRRPVFEGNWCCGSRCLGALVDAAIRREARESGAANEEIHHRHRVPLGLILLAQGRITHPQLQYALDAQRRVGSGRIGRWLIQECGLTEDDITLALSVQWGCPVLSPEGFVPEAMAMALPRFFVETLGIVPLRIAGGRILYLASANGVDASVAFALERMSRLKVAPGLLDSVQLQSAQDRLCACSFVEAACEQVADLQSMSRRITSTLAATQPRASRLVRLHRFFWLRMWLETGAMRTRDGGFPRSREDVADRIYTVGSEQ